MHVPVKGLREDNGRGETSCERDAQWKKRRLKGGVNKDGRKTQQDFCRRPSGLKIYQTRRNCPSIMLVIKIVRLCGVDRYKAM